MLKSTKLDFWDGLELKEASFQRRSFPTHFHDAYSIGIIRQGVEKMTVKDCNYILPTQSVVIVNAFEAHSNTFYNEEKWTYQSVYVNADLLSYFQKIGSPFPKSKGVQFQNFLQDDFLYQSLVHFHEDVRGNKREALQNICLHLLQHYQNEKPEQAPHYFHFKAQIEDIQSYLASNCLEKINLEVLAQRHKLSAYQFTRAFKSHTGLTPANYLTLLRLNHAKELLSQKVALSEVALASGFYDQSHLSNYFKKFFGITPLSYKRNSEILPLL